MDYRTEIEARLAKPFQYDWRSHGIGMLRTYLDPDRKVRLNLWHHRLVNPGISTMHTHPWGLRSTIMAGELRNTRWGRVMEGVPGARAFTEDDIPCGAVATPEFALAGNPRTVWLTPFPVETYTPIQSYNQDPHEIHTTDFTDGTATLMFREGDTDGMTQASVFWPLGTEWGDASRDTTREDITETISACRALWGPISKAKGTA